ncbi:MAG: PQ-loop domain-containing transporter [Mycoplasma sp.]
MESIFSSPIQIALFVFGILGAATTIGCFAPQGVKTVMTRDTSGLSKWFFIIALVSSVFWLLIGSLTIANGVIGTINEKGELVKDVTGGIYAGLPSIITNVVTVCINTTIFIIKANNMKEAKKANMSEADYCRLLSEKMKEKKIASKL